MRKPLSTSTFRVQLSEKVTPIQTEITADVLTQKHISILQCCIYLLFFQMFLSLQKGLYGTRSTTVFLMNYDGEASLYEKYLESGTWKDHTVHYQIE
jgi:uncharacterized protein with NRDE domain